MWNANKVAKIASFQFGTYKLLQTWLIPGGDNPLQLYIASSTCRHVARFLTGFSNACTLPIFNCPTMEYLILHACIQTHVEDHCFLPALFPPQPHCLFPIATHTIDLHTFYSTTVFLYTLTKIILSIHISMGPTNYSPRLRSLPHTSFPFPLTLPLHHP